MDPETVGMVTRILINGGVLTLAMGSLLLVWSGWPRERDETLDMGDDDDGV